jgi:molybdopterin synthase catalytic subunit
MSSPNKDFIKLTSENLILQDIINLVKDDGAGAITTFNGTTRNTFKGESYFIYRYPYFE